MPAKRYTTYTYLRALELEGRLPNDAGIWGSTFYRMMAGEGRPLPGSTESLVEHPEGGPLPPPPRLPSSMLRAPRAVYYRRLRSTAECERYLSLAYPSVGVALQLFAGWVNPPCGLIPMPGPGDQPLPITHSVSLVSWSREPDKFQFQNWWGEAWGDSGKGFLPYEYFDKYAFECWAAYLRVSYLRRKEESLSGHLEVAWTVRDESDHRIYGFEIRHDAKDERWGWAFVVERDGALEIEELYVRPEFRGHGYGRRLAQRVLELAAAKTAALRLWVPFADCRQENEGNYPAVVAVVRRLGLAFRPCPVRWAAYLATNEPTPDASPEPIEPAWIPERARCSSSMLLSAVATTNGAPGSSAGGASQPAFPAPGTPAWGLMNRRRAELIRKKNRERLTAEERDEYERLQNGSRKALEEAFPGQGADDEERLNRLEKRLREASEGRKE